MSFQNRINLIQRRIINKYENVHRYAVRGKKIEKERERKKKGSEEERERKRVLERDRDREK